jgi:endoglucanase
MTVSFTVNAAAFTITFNQNYTGAPANTTATTSGANNRLTAAQIPTPTRSGFTFAGWFNTSAATGGTQLTATTNHTANTTYWARWTASGGTTPNFQNMTAHQVVANMGAGWNLGNTFDAFSNGSYSNPIDSRDWTNWGWGANYGAMTILRMETGWLEAYPILGSESRVTQQLINNVKAAGFDTIRIPVTWHKALNVNTWNNNSPPTNFTIRADWMARVKQVVDWAIAADMYVILNTHHDEYIMPFETTAQTDRSVATLARLWSLIAAEFNNSYDHRLIFEVLNEPRVKGHAQEWEGGRRDHRQNLNRLNQAAVSAIRDTGGNNRWRILMIPTYAAGATPSWANNQGGSFDSFVMPADRNSAGTTINTVNKFILSIHSYEPGNFAGIWGPLTMSWSEAGIRDVMNLIQTNATRMGVPVVLGEWGSVGRDNSPTHANEVIRANHARFYVQEAARRGFVPVWWDTGILANVNTVEGRWGIMNRRTGAVHYTNITAAIREGLAAGRALR